MLTFLLVLLGGAIGTGFRFGISNLIARSFDSPRFPYATLIINVTGSLFIGLLAQLFDARASVSPELRAALMVGALGGYTTFSSYSLETLNLLRDGKWLQAASYAVGSVALGLLAVWLGMRLARIF